MAKSYQEQLIDLGLAPPVSSAHQVATSPPPAPSQVASGSSNFVEPTWFPVLAYAMRRERGATLFGPRGCGKSTAIRELASRTSKPTITMQCSAGQGIESLIGDKDLANGSSIFTDGPLTLAVRRGAWLIAEEANVMHPGVWSTVNTLTDHTGEGLRLPTGEVVPNSPDFRLVLVYNEGYAGTREVNAALKDRLMPVYCGYLAAAHEARLLANMTGVDSGRADEVVACATMIRAANLRFDLSPRSLARWINLVREAGLYWREAFRIAIMDLIGTPEQAGPQRACLEEIARNTVDNWY